LIKTCIFERCRLELEDPGFDYSVLCEFRARLLEGGAERILFDKILSALRGKKLVKSRTRHSENPSSALCHGGSDQSRTSVRLACRARTRKNETLSICSRDGAVNHL